MASTAPIVADADLPTVIRKISPALPCFRTEPNSGYYRRLCVMLRRGPPWRRISGQGPRNTRARQPTAKNLLSRPWRDPSAPSTRCWLAITAAWQWTSVT
jgi:hypothetical protein